MTESEILSNLEALGAKDTTSDVQKKNGTTCFTLPTGRCISEHKTGYIRVNYLNKKHFPSILRRRIFQGHNETTSCPS